MTAEEQGIVRKPSVPGRAFIAVDLDGTLARYERFAGKDIIGAPIAPMVERVKAWLAKGDVVIIFTARVAHDPTPQTYEAIHAWCEEHLGERLYVTATKERYFSQIWDDCAYRVVANEGYLA